MTLTIRQSRAISGPNVWTNEPITHLLVAFSHTSIESAHDASGLAERLTVLFPAFVATTYPVAPLEPIPYPIDQDISSLLGIVAVNLQRAAGLPVIFSTSRSTRDTGIYEVVVQHERDEIGLAACRLAIRLLNHLRFSTESDFNFADEVSKQFAALAPSRWYGMVTQAIWNAARQRGIPIMQRDPRGRITDLGTGPYQQRALTSKTSRTSAIAEMLLSDKALTNHYLATAGLPTPLGRVVSTVEGAVAAAQHVGYPVVLKPVDGGASVGVFVDMRTADEVRRHFTASAAGMPSGKVLVEQFIAGNQYRVVVINGQVIEIIHRMSARVIGDGTRTVRQLIEQENASPRRGPRFSDPIRAITVDDRTITLLERQGLTLDAIPGADHEVQLRQLSSRHQGETANRTDDAHPDNLAIFRQVAGVLGVDVLSMDVVAADIAQSIWTTSGAIIDVNTGSAMFAEVQPGSHPRLDPASAIVEMLFPPGQPVRAPIIAVTGSSGTATATVDLIAKILTTAGAAVGQSSQSGLFVAGMRIRDNDIRDPAAVRTLLANPAAAINVVQIDAQGIVAKGLGCTYCDVAVITSLSGLTRPSGKPVEMVLTGLCDATATLVLNADDQAVAALVADITGSVILISRDPANDMIRNHLDRGGQVVALHQSPSRDEIVLLDGDTLTNLLSTAEMPTGGETQRDVLLAAVAAAIALNVPIETIRGAVRSYLPRHAES